MRGLRSGPLKGEIMVYYPITLFLSNHNRCKGWREGGVHLHWSIYTCVGGNMFCLNAAVLIVWEELNLVKLS